MELRDQIASYFRPNLPVVALEAPAAEEMSMLRVILETASELQIPDSPNYRFPTFVWDVVSGFREVTLDPETGLVFENVKDYKVVSDPIEDAIKFVMHSEREAVFVLQGLQYYLGLDPNRTDYRLIRAIQLLVYSLKQTFKRCVLLGSTWKLAPELQGLVHEVSSELPTLKQIEAFLAISIADLTDTGRFKSLLSAEQRKYLARVSQGLTLVEIGDHVRRAVAMHNAIDERIAEEVRKAKMAKLRKMQVQFAEPPEVEIGGLDVLKAWLKRRVKLLDPEAQAKGLPPLKGLMLVGFPGCGKSLVAKAIGQEWGIPVLSVDMGSLLDSLVGSSEANLRRLLKNAEANAPCVLFLDEMEKALAGQNDTTGIAQRIMQSLLTWMQEKKASVFVVATSNDISKLPPELTRKGRFDEIFFVDLPTLPERVEILRAHLNKFESEFRDSEILEAARLSDGFSGAELAAAVSDASLLAAEDDRFPNISSEDLETAIAETVPLSVRSADNMKALREWASTCAKNASTVEASKAGKRNRAHQAMLN